MLVESELRVEVRSRPWKSVANASRRSHHHLTGRPTSFAAQATSANSGQVLLRMPKFPPTSPETTRTAAVGTLRTAAMSSRCRTTPPPAEV
jgi:predicted alpha/beta-hydrolase family hydrolase